jgi:surface protein
MVGMFRDARAFNQSLEAWDVSAVTNMTGMFRRAIVFNQPLEGWDVSAATNMNDMFDDTYASVQRATQHQYLRQGRAMPRMALHLKKSYHWWTRADFHEDAPMSITRTWARAG